MLKIFIALAVVFVAVNCRPQAEPKEVEEVKEVVQEVQEVQEVKEARALVPTEQELQQNMNAKYKFSSKVQDGINDLTQERSEVRDGLKVKGHYSYSDGFVKKVIKYEADADGYRIVGSEEKPLTGPHVDIKGTASVNAEAHGKKVKYQIQAVPSEEGGQARFVEVAP